MTILSCGVFAYAVNSIGSIFANIAERESLIKKEKYQIFKFMKSKNISKSLSL